MAKETQDTEVMSAGATAQTTDVDLESIKEDDLPEELKPKFKALMRGFHKKMQSVADDKKSFETEKEKLLEVKTEHDRIIKWYNENKVEDQIKQLNTYRDKYGFLSAAKTNSTDLDDELGNLNKEAMEAFLKSRLKESTDSLRKEMAGALAVTSEQFMDLAALQTRDSEMDWREVVKVAQKENLSDMKKAYNLTYTDKLSKQKVKEIREELEEEYKAKAEKDKLQILEESRPEGRRVIKLKKKGA